MPTNRTKRTRRTVAAPEWVARYLETGEAPCKDGDPEGYDRYIGWFFFGELVPGLPKPTELKTLTRQCPADKEKK